MPTLVGLVPTFIPAMPVSVEIVPSVKVAAEEKHAGRRWQRSHHLGAPVHITSAFVTHTPYHGHQQRQPR